MKHARKTVVSMLLCLLMLISCLSTAVYAANPATETTAKANRAWYDRLDFDDEQEKENALRGLIEAPESLVIYRDDGIVAWNLEDFAFVRDAEAPDTVNPSLWRNTQLNAYAGLFEVCDGGSCCRRWASLRSPSTASCPTPSRP